MANQRPTKREKRDELKRRRMEEIRRRQRRARMRKLYTIGIVAAVVVALVAVIVLAKSTGGKWEKEFNTFAKSAGCEPLKNPAKLTGTHIQPPNLGKYNSNPPTSGEHYLAQGLGPLPTGIHTDEVANEGYVHNLEHGHIVILYKPTLDPTILEGLKTLVRKDPPYMLLAPREDQPYVLSILAWGHLEGCNSPNAKAVDLGDRFYKHFKDKAPETHAPGTPIGV